MRILMIAINDPAGTAIRFCRALGTHTAHRCRLVTLETRYTHGWDKDLHVPDLDDAGLDELRDLLRHRDVLHFHMTADEHTALGPQGSLIPADFMHGKALVHHHHGHPDFRDNKGKYAAKYEALGRNNLLVSTPDLLHLLPKARWQPNLVPVNDPAYAPDERDEAYWDGPLRLTHSPTRKDLKNTDQLTAIVDEMNAGGASAGTGISLDLMDDVPHAECLRRKRSAHACFDHMQGYYGMSSLEAMSLGLATLAGPNEHTLSHVREFAETNETPWILVRNGQELGRALAALAADPALRREAGEHGRAFMLKRWSDQRAAARLADFYENLN